MWLAWLSLTSLTWLSAPVQATYTVQGSNITSLSTANIPADEPAVVITDTSITSIILSDFPADNEMTTLTLTANKQLVDIHPKVIQSLAQLQTLHISQSNIELDLSRSCPQHLSSLTIEDGGVSGATWATHSGPFSACLSLTFLNLNRNKLQHPPSLTSNAASLETLHLAYNEITHIAVDVFQSMPNLHTLNLKSNPLVTLPPMDKLSALANFYCLPCSSLEAPAGNRFPQNEFVAFTMSNLEEDQLRYVLGGSSSSLNRLDISTSSTLNLTAPVNNFTELLTFNTDNYRLDMDQQLAAAAHHLQNLDLRRYGLSMQAASLEQLTQLESLKLVAGSLDTLPSLQHTTQLKSLMLVQVGLTNIPRGYMSGLSKVSDLNLASNAIKTVPYLGVGDRLKELILYSNLITHIEPAAFNDCPKLKLIKLQSNQLTTLYSLTAPQQAQLTLLRLENNPMICDTRLQWMYDMLDAAQGGGREVVLNLACAAPATVAGTLMYSPDNSSRVALAGGRYIYQGDGVYVNKVMLTQFAVSGLDSGEAVGQQRIGTVLQCAALCYREEKCFWFYWPGDGQCALGFM